MRGVTHALLGVALALALTACDRGDSAYDDGVYGPADASEIMAASPLPATDDCLAAERQTLQEGGHLLGDAAPPVPYSSVPPTSGWHASGIAPTPGTYGEPLPEPALVLWLETGGVGVTYTPGLPEAQVRALSLLPGQVERTVVTPYEQAMPTPVAMVAWGWLQRCETLDAAALQAFADAYGYQDRSD